MAKPERPRGGPQRRAPATLRAGRAGRSGAGGAGVTASVPLPAERRGPPHLPVCSCSSKGEPTRGPQAQARAGVTAGGRGGVGGEGGARGRAPTMVV